MLLSDRNIKSRLGHSIDIEPFDPDRLQPASYDVALSNEGWLMTPGNLIIPSEPARFGLGDSFVFDNTILNPGDFMLGSTQERITINREIAAKIEGKSSLGRLGLEVHATAGYIDPGFEGHLTLELTNVGIRPILLTAGMLIGQISFMQLLSMADRAYGDPELGSKYQHQTQTPAPSR